MQNLRIKIPKRKLQKRSFNGYNFIESIFTGDYEELTFKDSSVTNICSIIDTIRLPFHNMNDMHARGVFGSITGPLSGSDLEYKPTYFYPSNITMKDKEACYKALQDNIEGEFYMVNLSTYNSMSSYSYSIKTDEEVFLLSTSGGRYLNGVESVPIQPSDSITDFTEATSFTLNYTIDEDFLFKSSERRSIKKIVTNAVSNHITQRVTIPYIKLGEQYKDVCYSFPSIPRNFTLNLTALNRLLNTVIDVYTPNFNILSISDKSSSIIARVKKLVDLHKDEATNNLETYAKFSKWNKTQFSDTVITLAYDSQIRRGKEKAINAKEWNRLCTTQVKSKNSYDYESSLELYTKTCLLEKFILALPELPFRYFSKVKPEYKEYVHKILTLMVYGNVICNALGKDYDTYTTYSRDIVRQNTEEISFNTIIFTIPQEIHDILVKNVKLETVCSYIFPDPIKKERKKVKLNLDTPSPQKLSSREQDLFKVILDNKDNFEEVIKKASEQLSKW